MILVTAVLMLAFSASGISFDNHCTKITPSDSRSSPQNRIALLDSLSKDLPNPGFVQTVRMLANRAGFALDYYEANATNVDLFMNLPRLSYSLVIFRTHGAQAVLTTSEPYSQNHVIDQLLSRIGAVRVNQTVYFAITPSSVAALMCGRFSGTVVLAMACNTMTRVDMADAFVKMGASAFIGWNGTVSISHSDTMFGLVIEMLLAHQNVDSTVAAAMNQIGPDPVSGARLSYYPGTRGQFAIP